VNVSRLKPWIAVIGCGANLLLGSACDKGRGDLREWQPSDHQPPAAVETTGQGEGTESGDSQVKAAEALWSMRCASCHGASGRGDGEGRPPGASLPDFSSPAYHAQRSDERLAEIIVKGQGLMPAFGDQLTPAGIAAVVGHMRTLRRD
jgi:mono/diheme cytochrome c family protein